MKTKKWYFKNNYELYNVLYEDDPKLKAYIESKEV